MFVTSFPGSDGLAGILRMRKGRPTSSDKGEIGAEGMGLFKNGYPVTMKSLKTGSSADMSHAMYFLALRFSTS